MTMDDRKLPPTLEELDARIRAARVDDDKGGKSRGRGKGDASGLGIGMRVSIELVSAVAVGAGLGYFLDVWLGTAPLGMVVLLLLGGAAGVMNVYRVVKGLDDTVGLGEAVRRKEQAEQSDPGAGTKNKEEDDARN